MKKKGTIYIPQRNFNPVIQAKKYDKILADYQKSKQGWEMERAGIRNHFSKITNFTSHDVKNTIHNMDAIISTLDIHNVTEEKIDTIKNCLNAMRLSLDDFYRLSFDGRKIEFTLLELSKFVILLNKASFTDEKIEVLSIIEDENEEIINQPFHNILQVLNNLMINSITAFDKERNDKKIRIKYRFELENVVIEVCDNAHDIVEKNREKIFELYYSTTGGSGIGLSHSTHILEKLTGSIKLIPGNEEYCTKFIIKFPKKTND